MTEPSAEQRANRLAAADEEAQSMSPRPVGSAEEPCPLKTAERLVVKVVGEDKKPVADVAVALFDDGGRELLGKSRADGLAIFDGLKKGEYEICLFEFDQTAWKLESSAPITAPQAHAMADWQAAGTAQIRGPLNALRCYNVTAARQATLEEGYVAFRKEAKKHRKWNDFTTVPENLKARGDTWCKSLPVWWDKLKDFYK